MNYLLSLVSGNSSPLGLPGGATSSVQTDTSFAKLVNASPTQMPGNLPFSAGRPSAQPMIFDAGQSIATNGLLPPMRSAGPLLEGEALPLDQAPSSLAPQLKGEAMPLNQAPSSMPIPDIAKTMPSTALADGLIPLEQVVEAPVEEGVSLAGETISTPRDVLTVKTDDAKPTEVIGQVEGEAMPAPAPATPTPPVVAAKTSERASAPTQQPHSQAGVEPGVELVGEIVQPSPQQSLEDVPDTTDAEIAQSDPSSSDSDTLPAQPTAQDIHQANESLPAYGGAVPVHSARPRLAIETGGDPETVEIPTGDRQSPSVAINDRQPSEAASPRSSMAKAPESGGTRDFAQLVQSNGSDAASPPINDGAGGSEMVSQFRTDPAKNPAEIVRPAGPAPETISARPGEIGRQLGVEIVRQNLDGRDSLTIRLDPAEMGEIQVRLQFDDKGTMRAHVSAESSVALEMLRRDSGDLVRALGDAGVRTDAQSFQFEARSQGRGDQQGQHNRPETPARQDAGYAEGEADTDDQSPRPKLRSSGSLDLFA